MWSGARRCPRSRAGSVRWRTDVGQWGCTAGHKSKGVRVIVVKGRWRAAAAARAPAISTARSILYVVNYARYRSILEGGNNINCIYYIIELSTGGRSGYSPANKSSLPPSRHRTAPAPLLLVGSARYPAQHLVYNSPTTTSLHYHLHFHRKKKYTISISQTSLFNCCIKRNIVYIRTVLRSNNVVTFLNKTYDFKKPKINQNQ